MQEQAPQQVIEPPITVENILDDLSKEQKEKIASECKAAFDDDLRSRGEWESNIDDWIALAKQTKQDKTYPWPGASNVKYPLVATAAMQFAARSYPSLVPSNGKVVNSVVIGKDSTGEKYEKAHRVSTYMSYQILH